MGEGLNWGFLLDDTWEVVDGVAGERLDRPPGQLRAEMLSPAGAEPQGSCSSSLHLPP